MDIKKLYEDGKISKIQFVKAMDFKESLTKTAAFPTRGAYRILEALAVGGAIGATSNLVNAAVERAEHTKSMEMIGHSYNMMLNSHPQLRMEDQEAVKNIYRTLYKFAPSLASDPFAAGSYVKRVLQFDPESGADYNVIQTLVDLEKKHNESKALRSRGLGDVTNKTFGGIGEVAAKHIITGE